MKSKARSGFQVTRKRKMFKGKYKKPTVMSLQRQISSIKRDTEYKWHDYTLTSFNVGLVAPLNLVPLGDDSITRDGRKIVMKSLLFRFYGASSTTGGAPRFIVFYDKMPNTNLPHITDVLTAANWAAPMNLNNRHRFDIIYDNTGGIGKGADPLKIIPASSSSQITLSEYIKLDHETVFNDTGSGTVAGTKYGGLYILFVGTGAGSLVGELSARIRFVDG